MSIRRRGESGQTLVLVAVLLVVLLGFAALAIDIGSLYGERRRMQNAADGAALAGVEELCVWRGGTQESAESAAIAMAQDYASRNGADWAIPVPTVNSNIDVTLKVTAGRTSNTLFAAVLGPTTAEVAATASATCESPYSGIPMFPLTIKQQQWDNVNCGETVYITVAHETPDPCPTGCDCSHVFTGASTDTNSERGWFDGVNNTCQGGSEFYCKPQDAVPWETDQCKVGNVSVGSCLVDKNGTVAGSVGGSNGKELVAWVKGDPDGKRTIYIPLYDDFKTSCSGSCAGYHVSGFACVDLDWRNTLWIGEGGPKWWPPAAGYTKCPDKNLDLGKTLVGTMNCNCTIEGGNIGPGGNDPKAAKIPVLIK